MAANFTKSVANELWPWLIAAVALGTGVLAVVGWAILKLVGVLGHELEEDSR